MLFLHAASGRCHGWFGCDAQRMKFVPFSISGWIGPGPSREDVEAGVRRQTRGLRHSR